MLYDPQTKQIHSFGHWKQVQQHQTVHTVNPLPPVINLTKLHTLIETSKKVSEALARQGCNLHQLVVEMSYKEGQLVRIADQVMSLTVHHWWDVFYGWPTKTSAILKLAIHPIAIMGATLLLLLLLICVMWIKVRKLVNNVLGLIARMEGRTMKMEVRVKKVTKEKDNYDEEKCLGMRPLPEGYDPPFSRGY